MKAKLFQNKISVRASKIHNYGVFADKNIRKGEVIEDCYAIANTTESETLIDFTFTVEDERLFLTGYGMIYNHSKFTNATFSFYKSTQIMRFVAKRFIRKGEEIFISYGDNWFKEHGFVEKNLPVRASLINPVTISLTRMALVGGALYGSFHLLMNNYQHWVKFMLSLYI